MQNVIRESEAWAWARGSPDAAKAQKATEEVMERVASDQFAKDFMSLPIAGIKKQYAEEDLIVKCGALGKELNPLIAIVTSSVNQLVKMHGVRE